MRRRFGQTGAGVTDDRVGVGGDDSRVSRVASCGGSGDGAEAEAGLATAAGLFVPPGPTRASTRRSTIMPTYISLVQFTDKGIQAAKETTRRVADWAAKVQPMGVNIKQMYWTLGHYDQVCVFDAPDDETAAGVLLAADRLGNIRTQTLRAFTTSEMEKILAKVP